MIIQIVMDFYGIGAVQKRARLEVQTLLEQGFNIYVVTSKPKTKELETNFIEIIKDYKGTFQVCYISSHFEMRLRKYLGAVPELFFSLKLKPAILNIIKQHKVNNIVSHSAAPIAFLSKYVKNIPLTYIVHALIEDRLRTGGNAHGYLETQCYKYLDTKACLESTHILPVSEYMAKICTELSKENKSTVVYNPIEDITISNTVKDIDVLFVGRFSKEKGIDILLKALKELENLKDLNVVFVGNGHLFKEVENIIATENLNIKLSGRVENKEVFNYMQRAKVLAVPSYSEPQGVVVLEGMMNGCCIVASKVGGIPEMIDNDFNGLLIESGNSSQLSSYLSYILKNENKIETYVKNARGSLDKFSLNSFKQSLSKFYETNFYKKNNI